MSEIHEKTNIFKVYNGDTKDVNRVVGVTDEMTLPNFENLTETISMAGSMGEVDSPAVGHYKATQIEIPFTNISVEALNTLGHDGTPIVLKSIQEITNTETLAKTFEERTITVKGFTTGINLGKLKKGGYGNPSIKKSVCYYKEQLGDKTVFELDVFNGKTIVNGQSVLGGLEDMI